jgi:hypothetical protein
MKLRLISTVPNSNDPALVSCLLVIHARRSYLFRLLSAPAFLDCSPQRGYQLARYDHGRDTREVTSDPSD